MACRTAQCCSDVAVPKSRAPVSRKTPVRVPLARLEHVVHLGLVVVVRVVVLEATFGFGEIENQTLGESDKLAPPLRREANVIEQVKIVTVLRRRVSLSCGVGHSR